MSRLLLAFALAGCYAAPRALAPNAGASSPRRPIHTAMYFSPPLTLVLQNGSGLLKPTSISISWPKYDTGVIPFALTTSNGVPIDLTVSGRALVLTVSTGLARQATINNSGSKNTGYFPLATNDAAALANGGTFDVEYIDNSDTLNTPAKVLQVSHFTVTPGVWAPSVEVTPLPSQAPLAAGPAGAAGAAGAAGPTGPAGPSVVPSVQLTSSGSTPLAGGTAGLWQNANTLFWQTTAGLQFQLNGAAILDPAAQDTGSINISGAARADGGFIGSPGASLGTLLGKAFITLDDAGGITLQHTTTAYSQIVINDAPIGRDAVSVVAFNVTDAPTGISFGTYLNNALSGEYTLRASSGHPIYVAVPSGTTAHQCALAEDVISSGAFGVNDVLVWTGSGRAGTTSSANTVAVAGVALTGASGSGTVVRMCIKGEVYANSDAGVSAGDSIVTSATTGHVMVNNSATLRTKGGTAIDAYAAVQAGQTLVMLGGN